MKRLASKAALVFCAVGILTISTQAQAQSQCETFFGIKEQQDTTFVGEQLDALTKTEKMTLALAAR